MKRFGFHLLICVSILTVVRAADIALVYENEAAVTQGKYVLATVIPEGVLIPAQLALSAGKNLLTAAPGQELHRGVLVRLDMDVDLAVIRLGEIVENPELQAAFRKKSVAVMGFIPPSSASAGTSSVSLPPMAPPAGEGWELKINGKPVGSEVIDLKAQLRKSHFDAEVVCLSTSPVWSFSLKLTSNPKVSFWKQGRRTSLNEVPKPLFTYDHQAMFVPLKGGKSVVVPIEAHFIDEKQEYDWKFEITSKKEKLTQTVRVKFH